ncbi:MAG TPA: cadherin domain-containing protein [Chloroflexota bacterium]|nr:cadherin domain-containing protein [Chloroflexota bacterium]
MLLHLSAIISRMNGRYRLPVGLLVIMFFMAISGRGLPVLASYLAAPVVEDQAFTVLENSATGTAVGTVVATDADTYAIIAGNELGAFAINASTGLLTVADGSQIDYETNPVFLLTVEVANPDGTDTGIMTINVLNINDAPVIEDQAFDVFVDSPNGTVVGTIVASDPDGNDLFYTILAGNTGDTFALGLTSGQLTVADNTLLSEPTTFTLLVRVSDGGLNSTAVITINVINDPNEPPVINNQTFSVPENSANGTAVGTVVATDPNDDPLTFGIIAGNTDGAFAINDTSGQITVANSAALDFETTPTFALTVRVTDTSNLTDDATITINLTNVNEFPPDINPQTFTIVENAANGAIVGTVVVTDSDGIDSFTFVILSGDPDGVFSINSAGVIAVANNSTLDFETTPSYSLDVQVTDSGALTDTAVMTINVLDANDPPIINDEDLDVSPGAIQETEMITLTGSFTDQDSGDAHTVTIDWGDGNSDVINLGADVTDFSASHTYLDDPAGPSDVYTIEVTVDDGTGSDSANASVTVTNVPPVLGPVSATPTILDEGESTTLSGTFTEISPLDTFVLTVDWGDGVVEDFNYAAGASNFAETHTYQDNYDPATIAVTLADDDGGSDSGETAVTVNNLPPTADAGPDLIVLDGFPANFNGAASDPGAWDTLTYDWDFGDGASDSGTLNPAHIYPGVGVYTATLTVTDDDGDSGSDTAVVTVIAPSDIIGLKTVSGSFTDGGTIRYTITLSNTGDLDQADNPGDEFVDELPAEIELTNAQVVSGGGTIASSFNTVTWNGAIPAGGSVVLEIEATILPGFRGQVVSNQGQIFYDGDNDGQNEGITYTDDPTQPGMFDPTTFIIQELSAVYLPIIMNQVVNAPDLVITAVSASSNQIELTIQNQGSAATPNGFWVDFYISPSAPPTGPNQLWYDLADEGLAWGVTALLAPGQSLTLVYSTEPGAPNQYFVPEESLYNGSLPAGTLVYAQVDSAREGVSYGGILETHEILGGPYNNIASGTAVAP